MEQGLKLRSHLKITGVPVVEEQVRNEEDSCLLTSRKFDQVLRKQGEVAGHASGEKQEEQSGNNAPDAPLIKLKNAEFAGRNPVINLLRDQVAGDDKKDVHANIPAGQRHHPNMK